MENKQLNVESRTEFGKNVNRRLRNDGYIPAVLYSHGDTESVKITKKEFFNLFKGQISESVIFDITITDKKEESSHMAFVKDYQRNPVTEEIIHLDLFKVTKGEKISTNIPLEVIGSSIGVRMGGVLEIDSREIEIECLPKDLPEKIEIDISNLEEGDSIHAGDIKLGEGLKLLSNPDLVVAAVHTPRIIEEEVEEEIEGEIGEAAEGEGASEEASEE